MRERTVESLCLVLGISSLSACAQYWESPSVKTAGGVSSLVTTAEYRTVNHLKRSDGTTVTCAEPSPDVAKAVASSFDVGTALSANLPSGVSPEAAAAISSSHASSIAQLAERLATIQTLRDGLYRACEAYANEAISATTYAAIVSRLDDTLVTLMLGEFAAGAFGRSLAALGTGAEGTASASFDLSEKQQRSSEAEASLDEATSRRDEVTRQLEQAEAAGNATEVAAFEQQLKSSNREVENAQNELTKALKAEASSGARAVSVLAAGSITAQQNPQIAETLATMQRNYIDDVNTDAIEIGCLTALSADSETHHTTLGLRCAQLMPELAKQKEMELLLVYMDRWQASGQLTPAQAREWIAQLQQIKGITTVAAPGS